MILEFLGVGSCKPEYEAGDTASLLIDNHILIDTGWNVIRNLLRAGITPMEITDLFFTHMHPDHCISLAAFLFYRMNAVHNFKGLTIHGPEGMEEIIRRALLFAGSDRHHSGKDRALTDCGIPAIHIFEKGETVQTGHVSVTAIESRHAVPGRCYRFVSETGVSLTYTGDTSSFDALTEFAKGSDVLVHEAAFAASDIPRENPYGHTSAKNAAVTASEAGAKALYLVHCPLDKREGARLEAKKTFENTFTPMEGDRIEI